jgi:hypothetical protein
LNQTSKTEERERERWRTLLRAWSALSISTNAQERETKMENFIKSMISIEHLHELSREREKWRTLLRAWSAVSISTNAQYVTRQKYFWHPTLGYNFFPTLPMGLEVDDRQLIATHLDQSIKLSSQSETRRSQ